MLSFHVSRRAIASLLLAVVCVVIYFFWGRLAEGFASDSSHNDVTLVMRSHETRMAQIVNAIQQELDRPHAQPGEAPLDTAAMLLRVVPEADYSVYLYRTGQLRFWRNACAFASNAMSSDDVPGSVVLKDNGYFYIVRRSFNDCQITCLFRICSRFPYDNDYLRDSFHPSFGLSDDASISLAARSGWQHVMGRDGRFLFSVHEGGGQSYNGFTSRVFLGCLLLVLACLSVIGALYFFLRELSQHLSALSLLALAWALLACAYFVALMVPVAPFLCKMPLFSLQVFAYDWWIPSFAHLMLLALFFLVWCYIFFRVFDFDEFKSRLFVLRDDVAFWFVCLFNLIVFASFNAFIDVMVRHSQDIMLYVGEVELSGVILARLVVISFVAFGCILVMEKVYHQIARVFHWRRFATLFLPVAVAAFGVVWLLWDCVEWTVWGGFVLSSLLFFFFKRISRSLLRFSYVVWVVFVMSIFVMLRISVLNKEKEGEKRQLLATNLAYQMMREDDPIAEQLLPHIQAGLSADSLLHHMIASPGIEEDDVYAYLRQKFFGGYFSRYDLQVVLCRGAGSTIQITNTGEVYDCLSYFGEYISSYGVPTEKAPAFFCLNDDDGNPCYLGTLVHDIVDQRGNPVPVRLFLELALRPLSKDIGYPELLTNKRDLMDASQFDGYSYAKYYDGKLAARFGDYDYSPVASLRPEEAKLEFIERNGFSHLLISPANDQVVVLSYPLLTAQHVMTNIAFVFFCMLVIVAAFLLLCSRRAKVAFVDMNISERIHYMFVAFVIVLLLVVSFVTALQAMQRSEDESRMSMSRVAASVTQWLAEISGDIGRLSDADIDIYLQKANSLFFADAHLFSPDGRLLASSRRELFLSGIVPPLMNDEALETLRRGQSSEVFVREHIGRLEHFSIYTPLYGDDDVLVGYVDVPYFTDVQAVHRQIMSTLLPINNTLMLIVLFSVFLSYFFAKGITLPIISLRDSLRRVDLNKTNVKLSYPYNDEIGEMVVAYNRMTDQLALSAEKLAATERESTWRQMARQIAHEIKNPLTPMKLSVQYMLMVWDSRRDDFEPMLRKTSRTLVEQIDQLSSVASQFSDIAKMHQAAPERFDLAARLSDIVDLFAKSENAQVSFDGPSDGVWVYADPSHLTSVFNNLIKNALQSVAPGQSVVIDVAMQCRDSSVFVDVADNGSGIPEDIQEKIFRPNFTTKSSGMGLGLAITRTIVVNSGGDISFDTQLGVGTTFHVRLPLA